MQEEAKPNPPVLAEVLPYHSESLLKDAPALLSSLSSAGPALGRVNAPSAGLPGNMSVPLRFPREAIRFVSRPFRSPSLTTGHINHPYKSIHPPSGRSRTWTPSPIRLRSPSRLSECVHSPLTQHPFPSYTPLISSHLGSICSGSLSLHLLHGSISHPLQRLSGSETSPNCGLVQERFRGHSGWRTNEHL